MKSLLIHGSYCRSTKIKKRKHNGQFKIIENGTDSHPRNADGSIIEFMGKASIVGFGKYSIHSIIVES